MKLSDEVNTLRQEKAVLEAEVKRLEESDADIRTKLSDALGAGTYKESSYSNESKQIVYSWFTIFREIGKLLERKKQANLEEAFGSMSEAVRKFDERFWKLENPGKDINEYHGTVFRRF